ncbi:MAG TPA: triose-phosphate isomerase, partial [Thermomicrobiales bacterium]|nr:triose-phosphate isomerase [Thermomicrobiales bacterium]
MTRYVLGNWKSNTTLAQGMDLAKAASQPTSSQVQVGIFPPLVWLHPLRNSLQGRSTWLGAQTCSATGPGAFTGEVTAGMLSDMCDAVLIGHSERRALYGENDAVVRAKLDQILLSPMVAVLCIGEVLEERQAGVAEIIVRQQLDSALRDQAVLDPDRLLIAYEPVWAIGTGTACSVEESEAMCRFVHDWCRESLGFDLPVLYGGSVNPENAAELIA